MADYQSHHKVRGARTPPFTCNQLYQLGCPWNQCHKTNQAETSFLLSYLPLEKQTKINLKNRVTQFQIMGRIIYMIILYIYILYIKIDYYLDDTYKNPNFKTNFDFNQVITHYKCHKIYTFNLVYEILLVLSSSLQSFQMFHKPFSYHRLQFIPSLIPF